MVTDRSDTCPLVAIVTPVYNGATYLVETMEAVQAQDYPNVVHVVLDNASTDDTPKILARYENARVPVRIARNDAVLPLVQNWNAAVALVPTEAKYFRTLCADDLIAPDYVSRVVAVAERHPRVGVVGCLFHTTMGPTIWSPWPEGQEVIDGREAIRCMFRGEAWIPSAHALYRTDEIARRQPFYDERVLLCDVSASLNSLSHSDLGFVCADLAMTRLHATNVTATVTQRQMVDMCEWLYFLESYAPVAFGERSSQAARKIYRRYYLRQLIKWRIGARREIYQQHLEKLRTLQIVPSPWQFADALSDWILVRLGLRPVWGGFDEPADTSRLLRRKKPRL